MCLSHVQDFYKGVLEKIRSLFSAPVSVRHDGFAMVVRPSRGNIY